MNIIYNHPVTDKELELFKLLEEFVYARLDDKSLYHRITVKFNERLNKSKSILGPSGKSHMGKNKYRITIDINSYAIRLYSNSCIRCNDPKIKSFEQLRYLIIFHEFAHLTNTYNDPQKLKRENISNAPIYYNKKEEDYADEIAQEFLKSKGILDRESSGKMSIGKLEKDH